MPQRGALLAGLAAGAMLLAAYGARKGGVCVDDAFITMAYARNLATGRGMVFQSGEYILGVTTPLWCWVQAAWMALWPAGRENPAALALIPLLVNAGAGLSVGALAWRVGAGWGAVAAGVAWLLLPDHLFLFGMEYGLATLLAVGALLATQSGRPLLAGGAAAMLCLTRPEAALLPILIFGWHLAARQWKAALLFALPVALVGAAALVAFQVIYGSPVPNTFGAKRLQMTANFPWVISVGKAAWRYVLVEVLRGDVVPAMLGLLGLGALVLGLRDSAQRRTAAGATAILLMAWVVVHVACLTLLKVAHYRWYLWPLWLLWPLALGLGMEQARALLAPCTPAPRQAALVALAVLLLASLQKPFTGDPARTQRERRDGYFRVAQRVAQEAEGKAVTLLASEIGALRWRLPENVRMLDEALLVTPNPTPGRFPSRGDFVAFAAPDFLVESHPAAPDHTPEQVAFQQARREEGFHLEFPRASGDGFHRYDIVERVESAYGLMVLYRRTTNP